MSENKNQEQDEAAQLDHLMELKKKRDEYMVEIRKKKREHTLTKKRNLDLSNDLRLENERLGKVTEENIDPNETMEEYIQKCARIVYSLKDLPALLKAVNSSDVKQQYYGVIGIRRIVSKDENPPIQEIIDANVIPRIIGFTERYEESQLQYEAAWALTNIASGTTAQTRSIIDKGGVTAFIRLLKHDSPEISEQAIWALGNIGGDNTEFRDHILKSNVLAPLIEIIDKTGDEKVIKHGIWALSNFARGNPLPKFELVKSTIPVFAKVIQQTDDLETLVDAAWAMVYLSDGKNENNNRVDLVLQTNICHGLVRHMSMDQTLGALVPVLRILGNLLSGTEDQASEVLEAPDVVEKLVELATTHQNRTVVRESCWCLSNIAAGNPRQVQLVMKDHDQISRLMKITQRSEPEIIKEVLWIFSNATAKASPIQMIRLVECYIIDLFCEYLKHDDPQNIEIALDGIANVLNMGAYLANQNKTENQFLIELENKGGVVVIDNLQIHPSIGIYKRALKILETHFELEDNL